MHTQSIVCESFCILPSSESEYSRAANMSRRAKDEKNVVSLKILFKHDHKENTFSLVWFKRKQLMFVEQS